LALNSDFIFNAKAQRSKGAKKRNGFEIPARGDEAPSAHPATAVARSHATGGSTSHLHRSGSKSVRLKIHRTVQGYSLFPF
jgi:hypothetical protein